MSLAKTMREIGELEGVSCQDVVALRQFVEGVYGRQIKRRIPPHRYAEAVRDALANGATVADVMALSDSEMVKRAR